MTLEYIISGLLISGILGSVAAIVTANKKGNIDQEYLGFKMFSFFIFASLLWCIAMLGLLAGV